MDPVLITIGGFEIRWYSVLILIAAFLVFALVQTEAARFKNKTRFFI